MVGYGEIPDNQLQDHYDHLDNLISQGQDVHQCRWMVGGEEINLLDPVNRPPQPPGVPIGPGEPDGPAGGTHGHGPGGEGPPGQKPEAQDAAEESGAEAVGAQPHGSQGTRGKGKGGGVGSGDAEEHPRTRR